MISFEDLEPGRGDPEFEFAYTPADRDIPSDPRKCEDHYVRSGVPVFHFGRGRYVKLSEYRRVHLGYLNYSRELQHTDWKFLTVVAAAFLGWGLLILFFISRSL